MMGYAPPIQCTTHASQFHYTFDLCKAFVYNFTYRDGPKLRYNNCEDVKCIVPVRNAIFETILHIYTMTKIYNGQL